MHTASTSKKEPQSKALTSNTDTETPSKYLGQNYLVESRR